MPIVSSQVEDNIQADGSHTVVVRFYDQDARSYLQSFHAPSGANIAAIVASRQAEMDESLKQQEFEQIVGAG